MRTRFAFPLFCLAALTAFWFSAVLRAADEPQVVAGFRLERIATVQGARELAAAPNGDLFVGTSGGDVDVIPHAEAAGAPGIPRVFAHFGDGPAAGVTLGDGALYVGTQFGIYRISYRSGDLTARSRPQKLAAVRTSGISRDHVTTSVAYDRDTLYASVGASCNACVPELDPTRATIQRIDLRTRKMTREAIRIRNAIALAINPRSGVLWAGVAGEDDLPVGHPYEIFDAVTLHPGVVDYGWPSCYENRKQNPKWPGSCAKTAVPRVIMPAYETPIGAVFYPMNAPARYAFPARYRGGVFLTLHGSWHGPAQGLSGFMPPRVIFVPMNGAEPATPANWSNPAAQWSQFLGGYQQGGTDLRIGRPTGIAVGPQGSLFVADDQTGNIYRIRPIP
ncbi:MAG TPA: hypothetical protein VIN40_02250 [Candidatus Tyrphobacter sp.]